MTKVDSTRSGERAPTLLRIASYLSRPQHFMAVAEACSEMRRTLQMAEQGSVVLTNHGEPEAAVVPFATLEDMRRALLHLLVGEMETSFARTQTLIAASEEDAATTSEEELESLVGDAVRSARQGSKHVRKRTRR